MTAISDAPVATVPMGRWKKQGRTNAIAFENGRDPRCVAARGNRGLNTKMHAEVIDDAA